MNRVDVNTVGLIASLIVGAAFVVAGASKVAAGPRWPVTAREMGAPAFTVPVVPWVEIAVGAGLVARLVTPVPAIVAIALLGAFTALILLRLSRGERPPCACFGTWSAEPIGPKHVVRNGILLLLAVLALWA